MCLSFKVFHSVWISNIICKKMWAYLNYKLWSFSIIISVSCFFSKKELHTFSAWSIIWMCEILCQVISSSTFLGQLGLKRILTKLLEARGGGSSEFSGCWGGEKRGPLGQTLHLCKVCNRQSLKGNQRKAFSRNPLWKKSPVYVHGSSEERRMLNKGNNGEKFVKQNILTRVFYFRV